MMQKMILKFLPKNFYFGPPPPLLCICSNVGKLTVQEYLSENCLVPVSELCRYPQKQQSVGTLPTPPRNKARYKVLNCNDTILWKKRGLGWMSILLLDEGCAIQAASKKELFNESQRDSLQGTVMKIMMTQIFTLVTLWSTRTQVASHRDTILEIRAMSATKSDTRISQSTSPPPSLLA